MRRDYRGSRGKLRLGTVCKTISRGPCWANQEANLLERLVGHGTARLDYMNAIAEKISIFEKYMSPQEARDYVEGSAEKYDPVVLRITPNQILSYDYS